VATDLGVEVRAWLQADRGAELTARRRRMAGPTGCGLCGVDSLTEAVRPPAQVGDGLQVTPAEIAAAVASLAPAQALGARTRAVHAAGWWTPAAGLVAVREDVGRHNALDKLVGALARAGAGGGHGLLLLTSRISVEMVQKAAVLGAQVLVAISAPTALAVRTAETAGITLIGVARDDGFEVFSRPDRVSP
jgi:FdhD protein